MKTVKMIDGAYGQRVGCKTRLVRLGETCQVDDQEAARLVGLNVAAYVEEEPGVAPPEDSEDIGSGEAEEEPPKRPQKAKKTGKGKSEDEAPPELSPEDPVT